MDKILNEKLRKSGWEEGKPMLIELVLLACDDKIKEIYHNPDTDSWVALPWYPRDINGKKEIKGYSTDEVVVNFYLEIQRNEKRMIKKLTEKK